LLLYLFDKRFKFVTDRKDSAFPFSVLCPVEGRMNPVTTVAAFSTATTTKFEVSSIKVCEERTRRKNNPTACRKNLVLLMRPW